MNKIMEWFTKKFFFIISLLSSIVFFILILKETLFMVCGHYNSVCVDIVGYFILVFMIGTTIFIPSLIMFFIKQEVFDSWKKTFLIYFLIYLLIIIITPWHAGDAYFRIQKDIFALGVSVIYLIFSIIFIIYKSIKK